MPALGARCPVANSRWHLRWVWLEALASATWGASVVVATLCVRGSTAAAAPPYAASASPAAESPAAAGVSRGGGVRPLPPFRICPDVSNLWDADAGWDCCYPL